MIPHPGKSKTDQPPEIVHQPDIMFAVLRAFFKIVARGRCVKRRVNVEILMRFLCRREIGIYLAVFDRDQFFPVYIEDNGCGFFFGIGKE